MRRIGRQNKKRVVVLGKGALCIKIAEWFLANPHYSLQYVVPVVPEPAWTDSVTEWAKKNTVMYIHSGNYADIPNVHSSDWKIDLAFSVFYDRIIKEWFIGKCSRILNIHNAPLPRYRGVNPINWALKNNEKKHGVTIHEISGGIDDGPIVSQAEYSIYPETDEVIDVYRRGLEFGWTLFIQTMPLIDTIIPVMQNDALATHYTVKDRHRLGSRAGFYRDKKTGLQPAHSQPEKVSKRVQDK